MVPKLIKALRRNVSVASFLWQHSRQNNKTKHTHKKTTKQQKTKNKQQQQNTINI